MSIKLTDGQQRVVDEAYNWYFNSSEQVFQISGAAGTGQSTVIYAIIQITIKISIVRGENQ